MTSGLIPIYSVGMPYTPTSEDLVWARMVLATLKNQGRWGIPDTGAVYLVDKQAKRLILIHGEMDYIFFRSKAVFGELGYEVVAKINPN